MSADPPDTGAAVTLPGCYRHPDRVTGVACSRCGRPICPECMRDAPVGFHCPDDAQGGRPARSAVTVLGGRVPRGRPGLVTEAIIAANVVMFVVTGGFSAGVGSGGVGSLFTRLALQPYAIAYQHQYYRLASAMFLHFGVLHIAFNMYALFVFGRPLEALLGRTRFLAVYLVAGLAGSAASYLLGPPSELAAGASGAVFGLFGAYAVVARRLGRDAGGALATIGLNLVLGVTLAGVDIRAHIGGLVFGTALAAAFAYAPGPAARRTGLQLAATVAALLAIAVVVLGHHVPTGA